VQNLRNEDSRFLKLNPKSCPKVPTVGYFSGAHHEGENIFDGKAQPMHFHEKMSKLSREILQSQNMNLHFPRKDPR